MRANVSWDSIAEAHADEVLAEWQHIRAVADAHQEYATANFVTHSC
jgi:hypothetical protein